MSNAIKIKDETIAEIKMLQSKFQTLHGKFGDLGIEKMQLDAAVNDFVEREKALKDEWTSLQKLERGLLDKIVETYGEGNLNMGDGTFVPTSPAPTPVQPPAPVPSQ